MVARIPPKEPDDILDEEFDFLTINVSKDWRMQWDGHQFQIQERKLRGDKGKNAGEVWWRRHAYISDLDTAIVWLARRRIYVSPGAFDGRALVHICKVVDEIKAECMKAFDAMMKVLKAKADLPVEGTTLTITPITGVLSPDAKVTCDKKPLKGKRVKAVVTTTKRKRV